MKRMICAALVLSLLSLSMTGCAEKTSTKTETEIKTPGGTTTITTEKDVKQTGNNPPSARP